VLVFGSLRLSVGRQQPEFDIAFSGQICTRPLLGINESNSTFLIYDVEEVSNLFRASISEHDPLASGASCSRACIALRELPSNSSIAILRLLLDAIELYGKPKVLRSDNGSTFISRLFRFALFWLGIRHQRTEPMAPWQNGRIERFFGTFKNRIRSWIAEGGNVEKLYQELDVFRYWYNHIRPHQNLDGFTPGEAWDGHEEPKSRGQPRFFEEWDGKLTGFL
jgi:hypothetical protein